MQISPIQSYQSLLEIDKSTRRDPSQRAEPTPSYTVNISVDGYKELMREFIQSSYVEPGPSLQYIEGIMRKLAFLDARPGIEVQRTDLWRKVVMGKEHT